MKRDQKKGNNANDLINFDFNSKVVYASLIASIVVLGGVTGIYMVYFNHPKVSTCYYHFNIQYKAGREATYDEIMYSMAHIIWMYGNHSTWNYTIETQFMTLEYMNENFPSVFAELKRQNQAGQLELIVPQYSDSWMIPYPLKSFKDSVNYTDVRMKEWGLIKSKIILLQEGQWIPGFGQIGDTGNLDAAILHREQPSYFNYFPDKPVLTWDYKGVQKYVIVNPRMPNVEAGMYHFQIYAADGELINTGDVEVDVGPAVRFAFNEEKQLNHERHLMQLEAKGNKFMRMDDFMDLCIEKGDVGKLDKYLPEEEWVPNQYDQFFTWMGSGSGETDDGTFIARVYRIRNYAQATEFLLDRSYSMGLINKTEYNMLGMNRINGVDGILLNASKKIWEAQVSDTTGISPVYEEFWYGMNRTYEALQLCNYVIDYIRNKNPGSNALRNKIQINPYAGKIYGLDGSSSGFNNISLNDPVTQPISKETIESEFDISLNIEQSQAFTDAGYNYNSEYSNGTYSTADWSIDFYKIKLGFYGLYNITHKYNEANYIPQSTDDPNDIDRNSFKLADNLPRNDIKVTFGDDNWSEAIYSPSLVENSTQRVVRADYFQYPYGADSEWLCLLPACNGMIYNPDGGYAIIKNTSVSHLAGNLRPTSVEFRQSDLKYNMTQEYFLVWGSIAEALRFANQINSYAPLTLEAI